MKETHDIVAETTPAIALMNILSHKDNGKAQTMADKFFPKLPNGGWSREASVELFVNGKPVSWEGAMREMMEIRKEEVDRLVGARVSNILGCEGIRQTVDQINNIQWTLRQKIEELAGEKIEWPEEY